MGIKVVLAGPPHSGKSCLREGLKQAISRLQGAPYPYVITACPDGEGAWFSAACQTAPELARRYKAAYKGSFSPEFAATVARWVERCRLPLALVDVGGRISPENKLIMSHATHAVVLAGDMSLAPAWVEFCRDECGLVVVAVLHSDYHGEADRIETLGPPMRGSVHYLERGVDVSRRPVVTALAELITRIQEEQS